MNDDKGGSLEPRTIFQESPEIAAMFPDLHPPLTRQAATIEADRCLNCFDAPCTGACPTHIDVPRFIKKIASGNLRGSALGILEANVLAASCSRVCPVEVLCEGACVMHHYDRPPIAIGKLQRHSMDIFHATGGRLPLQSELARPQKIACLGAGPASLAAAAELRQRGFQVTVVDKRAMPGGLNTYGVAEYKLSIQDSLREIELIADLGVEFRYGVEVVNDDDLEELEREFDAIFLGVGLGAMHQLEVPGKDAVGVVDALQFIEEYKLGKRTRVEGAVVVVGAGNTAIDAACAAKRLGASEVRILYRRTEASISAFGFEYEHARREGIEFDWLTQPVGVLVEQDCVTGVECVRTELLEGGGLRPVAESGFQIPCSMVIPAIGQSPLLELLSRVKGITLDRGSVVIDRSTGATTNAKYFAGGDCVNGGREVVDAVADGKRTGRAIAAKFEVTHGS